MGAWAIFGKISANAHNGRVQEVVHTPILNGGRECTRPFGNGLRLALVWLSFLLNSAPIWVGLQFLSVTRYQLPL